MWFKNNKISILALAIMGGVGCSAETDAYAIVKAAMTNSNGQSNLRKGIKNPDPLEIKFDDQEKSISILADVSDYTRPLTNEEKAEWVLNGLGRVFI